MFVDFILYIRASSIGDYILFITLRILVYNITLFVPIYFAYFKIHVSTCLEMITRYTLL